MMVKETNVSIRVAGNVTRIRTPGEQLHWRCYIGEELSEIPLRSFQITGVASPDNLVPHTDPTASNPRGLTAWIDFHGDIVVENDIAYITLKTP